MTTTDDHAAQQRAEGRRRARAERNPGGHERGGQTLKVPLDAKQWERVEQAARQAGQPVAKWARNALHERAVAAINKAAQKAAAAR